MSRYQQKKATQISWQSTSESSGYATRWFLARLYHFEQNNVCAAQFSNATVRKDPLWKTTIDSRWERWELKTRTRTDQRKRATAISGAQPRSLSAQEEMSLKKVWAHGQAPFLKLVAIPYMTGQHKTDIWTAHLCNFTGRIEPSWAQQWTLGNLLNRKRGTNYCAVDLGYQFFQTAEVFQIQRWAESRRLHCMFEKCYCKKWAILAVIMISGPSNDFGTSVGVLFREPGIIADGDCLLFLFNSIFGFSWMLRT